MSGRRDRGGSPTRGARARSRSRSRSRSRHRERRGGGDRGRRGDLGRGDRDREREFERRGTDSGDSRGRYRERSYNRRPPKDDDRSSGVVTRGAKRRATSPPPPGDGAERLVRKTRRLAAKDSSMDIDEAPVESATEKVIAKQSKPISKELAKLRTDRRKYGHVQDLANALQKVNRDGRYTALGATLRGFFVKNAPLSANTIVEPAQSKARGRNRERFSRRLDRDFTGGLAKRFKDPESKPISYHRTTGGDDHFWRNHLGGKLKKHLGFKKNITTYSSFDVEKVRGELQSTYVKGLRIKNENFLSAKVSKPRESGVVAMRPRSLTAWQNKSSIGAQSRANQAGMQPNLIQAFDALARIDDGFDDQEDVRTDEERDTPFTTFTTAEKEEVFKSIGKTAIPPPHKKAMLTDRRQMVIELGEQLNAAFKSKKDPPKYRVLLTKDGDDTDGLEQYPGLIIEEVGVKGAKANILPFLKKLTKAMQKESPISIANRQSFGFVAPTTSDLGTAVRIWPGLIPAASFKAIVTDAFVEMGEIDAPPVELEPVARVNPSPLSNALRHAQQRAYSRYEKESGDIQADLKEVHGWVDDRVVSNLIKAKELIEKLEAIAKPDDITLARAIRTLENLNEYDVLQAGIEEARVPVAEQAARNTTLLAEYEQTVKAGFEDNPTWQADHVKIMASGMGAYRTVSAVTGAVRDPKRVYFEIDNLTVGLKKNKFLTNNKYNDLEMVAQIKDLAYNFTSQADMDNDKSRTWAVPKTNPKIVIYDITNSTAKEALDNADDDADFVVMYESLSKHYQLGADKTTLGKLMVFSKKTKRKKPKGVEKAVRGMDARFGAIQHTPLPNGYLNYMNAQEEVHGDALRPVEALDDSLSSDVEMLPISDDDDSRSMEIDSPESSAKPIPRRSSRIAELSTSFS